MKIYINNFNLNKIQSTQNLLSDILVDTHKYSEIYTNESMYHVDNKNIFLLEPKDGEIIVYEKFYDNITLIVDHSYFVRHLESSLNGSKHMQIKIKKYVYKLNPQSKISLVIKIAETNDHDSFISNDIYFECDNIINITELFNKQELIEFLSLLN